MKQYRMKNKVYTVSECSNEDIPSHYERVLSYIEDTDADDIQTSMMLSILMHSAIKITDENGELHSFIYCLPISSVRYRVIAIWFERKPILAIMINYAKKYRNVEALDFHTKNDVCKLPYLFILSETSIRNHLEFNEPLLIKFNDKEVKDLLDRYYIKYNIEEV